MKPAFTYKGRPYSFAQVNKHWQRNRVQMMPEIGQVAVNFFKARFQAQAWTDRSAKKWQKRNIGNRYQKRGVTGKKSSRLRLTKAAKRDNGRAILVRTGKLRNSIKVKSASANHVIIGSNISYASAHNFGFKGNVRVKQHTRKIRGRVTTQNIETRRKSSRMVTTGSATVKSYTRKANIPQRQFMGNSHTLNMKFDKVILRAINKSF
ncbi:MAG: phage virion morphogenesis protein [Bacteroidota bacterium]